MIARIPHASHIESVRGQLADCERRFSCDGLDIGAVRAFSDGITRLNRAIQNAGASNQEVARNLRRSYTRVFVRDLLPPFVYDELTDQLVWNEIQLLVFYLEPNDLNGALAEKPDIKADLTAWEKKCFGEWCPSQVRVRIKQDANSALPATKDKEATVSNSPGHNGAQKTGAEVLEFARAVEAKDLKTEISNSKYPGLLRRRNYFLLPPDTYLIVKISRTGKPFFGLGEQYIDLFDSLTKDSGTYFFAGLDSNHTGWLLSKSQLHEGIENGSISCSRGAKNEYKINDYNLRGSTRFISVAEFYEKTKVK